MKFLAILCLLSIQASAQVRELYGTITDTAFGKEFYFPTICAYDTGFKQLHGPYRNCQEVGKTFKLNVSGYIKQYPYKIIALTIMRAPKEFIIYDTTRLPLNIVFDMPAKRVKNPPDKRRYDANVKLVDYRFYSKQLYDTLNGNKQQFKREVSNLGHELTLLYVRPCIPIFAPAVKFASDTLFIYSNKYEWKADEPMNCDYRSKVIIKGLKSEEYKVLLDGQPLTEQ